MGACQDQVNNTLVSTSFVEPETVFCVIYTYTLSHIHIISSQFTSFALIILTTLHVREKRIPLS